MVTLAQYRQQYAGGGMSGEVSRGVNDILQALLMYQLTQQKQEREEEQTRYDRATEQRAFAYGQAEATKQHVRSEVARIRNQYEQTVQGAFAAHGTRVKLDSNDPRRDMPLPFRSATAGGQGVESDLFDPVALGNALYEASAELYEEFESLQDALRDPLLTKSFNDAGITETLLARMVDREAAPLIEKPKEVYSMLMHSSEQGAVAAAAMRDRQLAGIAIPTSDKQKRQALAMMRYMPEMREVTDDERGVGIDSYLALYPLSAGNEAILARLKRIAEGTNDDYDNLLVAAVEQVHSQQRSQLKGKHVVSDSAMYEEQRMKPAESDANYYKRYSRAVMDFINGNIKPTEYKLISRPPNAAGNVDRVDTFTGELGSLAARRFSKDARERGDETVLVATLNDGDYKYEIEMNSYAAEYSKEQSERFVEQAQYAVQREWEQSVRPVVGTDQQNQTTYETFKGYSLRPPRVGPSPGEQRTELRVPENLSGARRLNYKGQGLLPSSQVMPGDEARSPQERSSDDQPDVPAYPSMPLVTKASPAVRDASDSEPVLDFLERAGTRALVELLPRVLGKAADNMFDEPLDAPASDMVRRADEFDPSRDFGPPAYLLDMPLDMPPAFPLDMPPPNMLPPDLLNDQPAISPEMQAQNDELDRLRFLMSDEAATMFAAGEERERQRQGAMENYLLLQDLANDINQEQERQRLGAMQNYELLGGWLDDIEDERQRNEYRTNVRDADMPSSYPLQEGILRDRGTDNLDLLQDIIRLGKEQSKRKASDPGLRGLQAVSSLLELSREAKELEGYNERMQRMYGSRNK